MSEEQQNELVEKKPCACKIVFIVLTILSFAFSLAALTTSIFALNNSGAAAGGAKKVVISKQYDKGRSLPKAIATEKPMIVFFYTDWCGFCQRFVPVFDKITKMKKIKSNFAIAYVNCEDEKNQKYVQEYDIKGFPTVYVVDEQGKRTQLDNGTFFNDDTKEVVSKKALELIGKE